MQSNKKTDNRKTGTLSWEPKVTKKNGPLYKAICEQLKATYRAELSRPGRSSLRKGISHASSE